MPEHLQKLKEITHLLLKEPLAYDQVRDAAYSLKALFETVTYFTETGTALEHIETLHGRAVSPTSAAICIIDFMRTRVFIKGIAEAISTKLNENNGRPVTVFYAGTGPFATLLTPLISLFSAGELKMVLLDLNELSIDYLKKTIAAFHMEEYVLDIIHADASSYQMEAALKPDIIVTETMMQGLHKEPMVNIYINLAAQCPAAIMIPELVKVEAALISTPNADGYKLLPLKILMELSSANAANMKNHASKWEVFNNGIELVIPSNTDTAYRSLALLTYIKVFSENDLQINESSLTMTFNFKNAKLIKDFPTVMRIKYVRSPNPEFQFCDAEASIEKWCS
ncbi:MAG: hypothetical protein WCJ85_11855 [Chitinophagaceae bacterium]